MKCKSVIFLVIVFIASCKKGGTGGTTNIIATVTHHGKTIAGAKVFIKYGSYNFPGSDTSIYNSRQLTNSDGYSNFKDLKRGYYYFYAVGFDSAAGHSVTGSAGLKIKQKDKGHELELNIPVTE